jgi:hypothetical protein
MAPPYSLHFVALGRHGPGLVLRGPTVDFADADGCPSAHPMDWLLVARGADPAASLARFFGCPRAAVVVDPAGAAPPPAAAPTDRAWLLGFPHVCGVSALSLVRQAEECARAAGALPENVARG